MDYRHYMDDKSLDDCFLAATGSSYADFEAEWQNYVRRTYKWMWFYELDDYIWIFIFVLLVMAFVFRKLRNKKIEHEWREEPDAMEPNDDEDNLLL